MKQPPNIIYIFSDTHRFDAMSFSGTPQAHTPNMLRLKEAGISFTNCFSTLPICVPYRVIMQTGKYPFQQGGIDNGLGLEYRVDRADNRNGTLAHIFKNAGYKTVHTGKWHLGVDEDGTRIGYDESNVWLGGHANLFDLRYLYNGKTIKTWGGNNMLQDGSYSGIPAHPECVPPAEALPNHPFKDTAITDQACQYLSNHNYSEKPLFMTVAYFSPHLPYKHPDKDQAEKPAWAYPVNGNYFAPPHTFSYYQDSKSLPFLPYDTKHSWKEHQAYYSFVTAIDDEIGRIMNKVNKLAPEIRDNTIIIYTSDHGGMGGYAGCGYGSKRNPHDPSSRTPFLISWPEKIKKTNIELDTMFSTVDILPTLCGLADIRTALKKAGTKKAIESLNYLDTCLGVDIADAVLGKPNAPDPESIFISHCSNIITGSGMVPVHRTLITKDHLYSVTGRTRNYTFKKQQKRKTTREGDFFHMPKEWGDFVPGREWLLFDRKKDPLLLRNLVDNSEYNNIRKKMKKQLKEWLKKTEYPYYNRFFSNSRNNVINSLCEEYEIAKGNRQKLKEKMMFNN